MSTKIINLSIENNNYEYTTCVKGEINSRFIEVHVQNNSEPYDLTNKTVNAFVKKSDNTTVYNTTTMTNPTEGIFVLALTSEISAVTGTLYWIFRIIGANGSSDERVVGLVLEVLDGGDDTNIVSSNEFTVLQQMISEIQSSVNEAATAVANCNTATSNSITATALTNTATDLANQAAAIAKHMPYVDSISGFWYEYNSATLAYVKTTAYASAMNVTFELDPITGILYENVPDNYKGTTFGVNNSTGYLEAIL